MVSPRRIVQAPAKTVGKAFEIAVERRAALDMDDVDLPGGAAGALPDAMSIQTAFFCCAAVHEVQAVQIGGTGQGRHDTEAEVAVQSRRVDMEVYVPVPDQQARPERAHGMDHAPARRQCPFMSSSATISRASACVARAIACQGDALSMRVSLCGAGLSSRKESLSL